MLILQLPPVQVEIPWFLKLFAAVGLFSICVWMAILCNHADREKREEQRQIAAAASTQAGEPLDAES
jgi:hypothetical protein